MNVEQLIKLIDAGYTKEDIQAMMEQPKATPAPEVKPEPINEKQENPAEQPEEKKKSRTLNRLTKRCCRS